MTQQRLSQLPEPLPVYQGEDLQSFIDRASRYAYLPPRVIWRMLGYRGAPHVRCRAVGDDFFALLGHLSHQAPSVLQERLTNWRHDSPSEERQGNPAVQHHQSITSGCPRCRIEADGARTDRFKARISFVYVIVSGLPARQVSQSLPTSFEALGGFGA